MKKLLVFVIIGTLLLGLFGCGGNNGGNNGGKEENPPEPEITGEMVDVGRFSVLVPDGWCCIDLSEYADGFSAVLLKGTQDDWFKVPQVSVLYCLPTQIIVSSAAFFENVIQQPDFDMGDYHWSCWTGTNSGLKSIVAETEGEFGYITVGLQQVEEGGDIPSLDDREVQAIIKSIVVEPTTEVSWVNISNGKATAELTAAEGYLWEETGYMITEGVEVSYELEGNTVKFDQGTGTGVFRIDFRLVNEDCTEQMGEAEIAFKVVNGKIEALYDAFINLFDEPQEIGGYDDTDDTDYEYVDQLLVGVWVDNANDLTMFIQNNSEVEHGYFITIRSSEQTIVAAGHVEYGGTLWYEQVSLNGGEKVDSNGWFMIDGDMLIWGHDEVVGEYENANLFTKAE